MVEERSLRCDDSSSKAGVDGVLIRVGSPTSTARFAALKLPGIEWQPYRRYAGFVVGGLRLQDLASIFERRTVR